MHFTTSEFVTCHTEICQVAEAFPILPGDGLAFLRARRTFSNEPILGENTLVEEDYTHLTLFRVCNRQVSSVFLLESCQEYHARRAAQNLTAGVVFDPARTVYRNTYMQRLNGLHHTGCDSHPPDDEDDKKERERGPVWFEVVDFHVNGCMNSDHPERIIQGANIAEGVYFRQCDGTYRNALRTRIRIVNIQPFAWMGSERLERLFLDPTTLANTTIDDVEMEDS